MLELFRKAYEVLNQNHNMLRLYTKDGVFAKKVGKISPLTPFPYRLEANSMAPFSLWKNYILTGNETFLNTLKKHFKFWEKAFVENSQNFPVFRHDPVLGETVIDRLAHPDHRYNLTSSALMIIYSIALLETSNMEKKELKNLSNFVDYINGSLDPHGIPVSIPPDVAYLEDSSLVYSALIHLSRIKYEDAFPSKKALYLAKVLQRAINELWDRISVGFPRLISRNSVSLLDWENTEDVRANLLAIFWELIPPDGRYAKAVWHRFKNRYPNWMITPTMPQLAVAAIAAKVGDYASLFPIIEEISAENSSIFNSADSENIIFTPFALSFLYDAMGAIVKEIESDKNSAKIKLNILQDEARFSWYCPPQLNYLVKVNGKEELPEKIQGEGGANFILTFRNYRGNELTIEIFIP